MKKQTFLFLLCVCNAHTMQQPLSKENATQNLQRVIKEAIDAHIFGAGPTKYRNNFNPIPQVEQFIKAGADLNKIDSKGNTPLANAIWLEDVRLVMLLLKNGANVNQLISYGTGMATPLTIAIFRQNAPIARLLLNAKANPNLGTYVTHTALETAIINGDSELVSMLIKAGVDVNRKREDSLRTPLMLAIKNNDGKISMQLIEAGADINAQDSDGNTALHWALKKQNLMLLRILLEAGADIKIKNNKGLSSQDTALASHNPHIANLFSTQKIK